VSCNALQLYCKHVQPRGETFVRKIHHPSGKQDHKQYPSTCMEGEGLGDLVTCDDVR